MLLLTHHRSVYISVLVRRADLQDLQDHFFENVPLTCGVAPIFGIFVVSFAWIKGGSAGSKCAVLTLFTSKEPV